MRASRPKANRGTRLRPSTFTFVHSRAIRNRSRCRRCAERNRSHLDRFCTAPRPIGCIHHCFSRNRCRGSKRPRVRPRWLFCPQEAEQLVASRCGVRTTVYIQSHRAARRFEQQRGMAYFSAYFSVAHTQIKLATILSMHFFGLYARHDAWAHARANSSGIGWVARRERCSWPCGCADHHQENISQGEPKC